MSIAERMQAQLAPYQEADPAGLLDALATGFAAPLEICDVARDTDTHIAWGSVLDPDVADARLLPWLAQFSGDQLLPSDSVQDQRDRLTSPSNFYRGTVEAIRAEMQPTLTGAKQVLILERTTNEWTLTVITRTSETPSPAVAEAAGRRQIAPWLIATFIVTDAPIIDEAGAAKTYDSAGAAVTYDSAGVADVS